MTRPNWATINANRKAKERGTEDATGRADRPGKALLEKATAGRNEKLRLYLETGPRGERDVEPLLDAMTFRIGTGINGAPIMVSRAVRDGWLRGVMDACQPD